MSQKFVKLVKSARRGKNLSVRLKKQFALVVAAFGGLVFGSAYLVWKNETMHGTYTESLWTVLFTLIGQGEFASNPRTITGRIIVFVLSIIGVALLGVVFSELVQRVMNSKLKEMMGMTKCRYKGHTVICGWSERGKIMLKELLGSGKQASVICKERPLDLPQGEVFFVAGNPSDDDVLQRAGITEANAALVLADPSANSDSDAKTILIALAIESANPTIYSIIELIKPENERHARLANVDDIIYCDKLLAGIAATCAVHNGISAFVRDILCATDCGHHIAAFDVPDEFNGRTIGEFFTKLRAEGKLPVGITVPPDGDPRANPGQWISKVNPSEDLVIKTPTKAVCLERN